MIADKDREPVDPEAEARVEGKPIMPAPPVPSPLTDGLTADERIWLRAFRVNLSAHSMFGNEMSARQAAFEAELEVQKSQVAAGAESGGAK